MKDGWVGLMELKGAGRHGACFVVLPTVLEDHAQEVQAPAFRVGIRARLRDGLSDRPFGLFILTELIERVGHALQGSCLRLQTQRQGSSIGLNGLGPQFRVGSGLPYRAPGRSEIREVSGRQVRMSHGGS